MVDELFISQNQPIPRPFALFFFCTIEIYGAWERKGSGSLGERRSVCYVLFLNFFALLKYFFLGLSQKLLWTRYDTAV